MNLDKKIAAIAAKLEPQTIAQRRDLHAFPESGWTEFRTASTVIKKLTTLGYTVTYGAAVIKESSMMGVPDQVTLKEEMSRAIDQGADPKLVANMSGGKTGVVATMQFAKPGKTVALRFDMDCNEVTEAIDDTHRPAREGFASRNAGRMHACGHDGHTSAGLAVAEIIASIKDELCGTIKFIFQPAEEGVRGAKAMADAGVVDDVDYLLASHLMTPKTGYLAYDVQGFLATSKFDATFTGVPAHAGAAPEVGNNSLLAAATAAINLQAISRHSDGISRINVGVLKAGTGRNVVPANAIIKVETRGATSAVNDYLITCAEKIIHGAAAMYDNTVEITAMGSAIGAGNTVELSHKVKTVAERIGCFDQLVEAGNVSGSEDCSYLMGHVQANRGQAAYLIIGASLTAINHNLYFDFDEHALTLEAQLLATVASDLLNQ